MRREQWTIGLLAQSAESVVHDGIVKPVTWLAPPEDGFLADPCVAARPDGDLMLFAEVLDYSSFKGRIAAAKTTLAGLAHPHFDILVDQPAHLSYPQLVPWGREWLLFGESWEAGCIPVFCAPDLAGPWQLKTRMLPGVPAVDPTPVFHQGRWYLFHTRQDDAPNARLYLLHGDTPLGPWRPHALGIVREDPAGARPAGPLIRLPDGALIRPGQDCRETYGGALSLYRVDVLTADAYAETLVRRVRPPAGPFSAGLHTLCPIDADHCLVDGKRWKAAPLDIFRLPRRMAIARARRAAALSRG